MWYTNTDSGRLTMLTLKFPISCKMASFSLGFLKTSSLIGRVRTWCYSVLVIDFFLKIDVFVLQLCIR